MKRVNGWNQVSERWARKEKSVLRALGIWVLFATWMTNRQPTRKSGTDWLQESLFDTTAYHEDFRGELARVEAEFKSNKQQTERHQWTLDEQCHLAARSQVALHGQIGS